MQGTLQSEASPHCHEYEKVECGLLSPQAEAPLGLPRGADDALIDESLPSRNGCGPLVMLGGGVSIFPFLLSPKLQTCTVVPLLPVALSPVA